MWYIEILIGNGITIDFPTIAFAVVSEQQFTAKLFGEMEVPSIETNAIGLAEFKPKLNGNVVAYSLNVTDIDNVTAAYINSGEQGQNGPIVVTLFQPDTPTQKMVSGLLSEGNITSANFEGPLASKQLFRSPKFYGFYGNIFERSHYSISRWRNPWTNIKFNKRYDDEMMK